MQTEKTAGRKSNKIKDPVSKQIKYKCQDIQNSLEKYYLYIKNKLYAQMDRKGDNSLESLLLSLHLPATTEDQNKMLLAHITPGELQEAISKLKPNKTPGSDGFYRGVVQNLCRFVNSTVAQNQ